MKIALIGATGFVGGVVLNEALQRGHSVTALLRDPARLAPRAGLTAVQADVLDAAQVAAAVEGLDAVVSAYNPGWANPDIHDEFLRGSAAINDGLKRAGVKRLLVVGGAGSLFVAPGLQAVDTPDFPAAFKAGALAAREALNRLQAEPALDWTFLSPPFHLLPMDRSSAGERRGSYRIGGDTPVMGEHGPAEVSVADLAVAIVDEIERPQHLQRRFTVGY